MFSFIQAYKIQGDIFYGGQSRSTEKIITCTVHLTLSAPIGQSKFARLPFLRFHWHFLNNSELLKTSLQTSTWRCGQFIHARAPNEKKRAFIREIDLFLRSCLQCSCIFGSGRKLLVIFMLPMFVMLWVLSWIWFCCWERLQLGRAASLGIDRLGRKQKME